MSIKKNVESTDETSVFLHLTTLSWSLICTYTQNLNMYVYRLKKITGNKKWNESRNHRALK